MGKFSFHIEKQNVDKFDKCIRGAGGRGVLMFSTCCAEVRADCIFRVLWEALDGALFVEYSPPAIPPRSSFKSTFSNCSLKPYILTRCSWPKRNCVCNGMTSVRISALPLEDWEQILTSLMWPWPVKIRALRLTKWFFRHAAHFSRSF